MNSDSSGRDDTDILLFAEELAEVKALLREASRQLLRIERRVTAAFPGAISKRSRTKQSSEKRGLDEAAAQLLIDRLKDSAAKGEQIEEKLRDFAVKPELQFIARILGMTNSKLPPKDELVRRISTRIRQSASLRSGFQEDSPNFKGRSA
jgi:hypothetical protein